MTDTKITVTIKHNGIRYTIRAWPEEGAWVVECQHGSSKSLPVDRWWNPAISDPWIAIAQMVDHRIGRIEAT